MDLFFRMSYGKNSIKKEILDAYVSYVRVGTGVTPRDVTLEDWKSVEEFLIPLFGQISDSTNSS
jgi:molybdopterin biosynthesis enzyme MoaB